MKGQAGLLGWEAFAGLVVVLRIVIVFFGFGFPGRLAPGQKCLPPPSAVKDQSDSEPITSYIIAHNFILSSHQFYSIRDVDTKKPHHFW